MSNGKVVITSKEFDKIESIQNAVIECDYHYVEKDDALVWYFKIEDDAIRATRAFMEAGLEYVKRVI